MGCGRGGAGLGSAVNDAVMYEATARTLASPAAIWVIVVVMSFCTAILVAAPALADSRQARGRRRRAGHFSLESVQTPEQATVLRDAGLQPNGEPGETARPEEPPVTGRPLMPTQRRADTDQAEWSQRPDSDGEPGRP